MGILLAVFKDLGRPIITLTKKLLAVSIYSKGVLIVALFVVIVVTYSFLHHSNFPPISEPTKFPVVNVAPVNSFSATRSFTTIGQVESLSSANLQTEVAGMVTSVSVGLGTKVLAGAVLATIENSIQKAQLLQAQGAYDAARAGANQGTIALEQADNGIAGALTGATAANRSAFTTVNSILLDSLDIIYSNPTTGNLTVRLNSNVQYLTAERLYFRQVIPDWQSEVKNNLTESDVITRLEMATKYTSRLLAVVETLLNMSSNNNNNDIFAGIPLTSYKPILIANQVALNGVLTSLNTAKVGVVSAKTAHSAAAISGSNGADSLTSAQVKIALGTLRAAEAGYQKTIIRSPISGVVNALYLSTGNYVTPGMPAAIVANNVGLQVKAYLNYIDSDVVQIGDVVEIDRTATGTVTAKAGAVDPTTGKVALTIAVDGHRGIKNGSTVSLIFSSTPRSSAEAPLIIPIAALKISATGPEVFTVTSDNTLEAHAITLGPIKDSLVEVVAGVTDDMMIVTDARTLSNGQKVTVTTN